MTKKKAGNNVYINKTINNYNFFISLNIYENIYIKT